MIESNVVKWAASVAHHAHVGQLDKIGTNYFTGHVQPVANMVRDLAGTETQVAAAFLHDVVEDTDWTLDDLAGWFPDDVVQIVDALTRRENESYEDFISRVVMYRPAVLVKLCDVMVNLSPHRLQYVERFTRDRLVEKYSKALPVLWREYVRTSYHRSYSL